MISNRQTSLQKRLQIRRGAIRGVVPKVLLGGLLVILIGSFVLADVARTSAGGSSAKIAHRGIELTDARGTRSARQLAAFFALNEGQLVHPDQFLNSAREAAMDRAAKRQVENPAFHYLVGVVERLRTADELGIPKPGKEQLAEYIRGSRMFANQQGAFDPTQLKRFTDIARERLDMSGRDIDDALANAWRIQKVATLSAPAKTPALDVLARRLSEKSRSEWKVERAQFERAQFKGTVTPDEKADEEFFKSAPENYRIPEMSRVRVIRVAGDLKTADSLPAPTASDLTELAGRRRDKFPLAAFSEPAKFIADNRAELMKTWREEKAGEAAAEKLSKTLLTHVAPGDSRPDDARVDAMLKAAGLTAKPLAAYGRDNLPVGTGIPDALLAEALTLNATRWRSGAIPFGPEAYAFVFDSAIPSRLPEFAEVKKRVATERAAAETDRLFAKAADAKAAEIAAAVKSGKKFADAAKAAGLKTAPVLTFEYQNAPAELEDQLQILETVPVGGVSGALRSGADRTVAHIVARTAPAVTKEDPLADRIAEVIGSESARATATTLGTGN